MMDQGVQATPLALKRPATWTLLWRMELAEAQLAQLESELLLDNRADDSIGRICVRAERDVIRQELDWLGQLFRQSGLLKAGRLRGGEMG